MKRAQALVIACLLAIAGCANPLGLGATPTKTPTAPLAFEDTPTTTATSPTPGASSGGSSPTPTHAPVTDTPSEDLFPPGVSPAGIDNASTLFRAHTHALKRTGFVAVGNGSSVVHRSGVLVEVESTQRNRASVNGSAYDIRREVIAGPIERDVHVWSNDSIDIEYVRRQSDGETNVSTGERRPMVRLTGNGQLGPYVRGGDFAVREVQNESEGPTLVVLDAAEVDNATILRRAITDDAEEITAYEAVLVIDPAGRIRSLDATIEYVIDGQTVTQEFNYTLERIANVQIPEPDWIDEARATEESESGEQAKDS